jgi:beta-lactamase superfamily II metal-dependent hydrolase
MKISIYDVDHGFSALVTTWDGVNFLIDCGKSRSGDWSPSSEFAGSTIDTLVIQNLDEDHVQDLPNLLARAKVKSIFSNPSVDANALEELKTQGMRSGVATAWQLLKNHGAGLIGTSTRSVFVEAKAFWNLYPNHFEDTNNLSVATIFRYGDFSILFGGDLEGDGWRQLLQIPLFRSYLPEIRVFVASHHGRQNGISEELFAHMAPEITVVSDGAIEHRTQGHLAWYRDRTKGIPVMGKVDGFGRQLHRWVYTTRKDGQIDISVGPGGRYLVEPRGRQKTNRLLAGRELNRLSEMFLS